MSGPEEKRRRVETQREERREYTVLNLARSVERLHFCKNGNRKESVLWADVKKYYKKHTGGVLSTEAFNKLAGVEGLCRKELIAGPLAGLLVAEDPAALLVRFKYDANKGDALINHRYLEATRVATNGDSVSDAASPAVALNRPSSPSHPSSSLSLTCLSSISTDPETEALSPLSAPSPPRSPDHREYRDLPSGKQSFLDSPVTSDWETSSCHREAESRDDTASPESQLDRSTVEIARRDETGVEGDFFPFLDLPSDVSRIIFAFYLNARHRLKARVNRVLHALEDNYPCKYKLKCLSLCDFYRTPNEDIDRVMIHLSHPSFVYMDGLQKLTANTQFERMHIHIERAEYIDLLEIADRVDAPHLLLEIGKHRWGNEEIDREDFEPVEPLETSEEGEESEGEGEESMREEDTEESAEEEESDGSGEESDGEESEDGVEDDSDWEEEELEEELLSEETVEKLLEGRVCARFLKPAKCISAAFLLRIFERMESGEDSLRELIVFKSSVIHPFLAMIGISVSSGKYYSTSRNVELYSWRSIFCYIIDDKRMVSYCHTKSPGFISLSRFEDDGSVADATYDLIPLQLMKNNYWHEEVIYPNEEEEEMEEEEGDATDEDEMNEDV